MEFSVQGQRRPYSKSFWVGREREERREEKEVRKGGGGRKKASKEGKWLLDTLVAPGYNHKYTTIMAYVLPCFFCVFLLSFFNCLFLPLPHSVTQCSSLPRASV